MAEYIEREAAIKEAVGALKGVSQITAVDVVTALEEIPAADVVSRADYATVEEESMKYFKSAFAKVEEINRLNRLLANKGALWIGEERAKVAREIFEEIDAIREKTTRGNIMRLTFFKQIYELKKKYTIEPK